MKKVLWLMSVILALALVITLTTNLATAAAQFKVSDLTISPTFITAGSADNTINISVKVANTGDQAGTYKLELKVNNKIEKTQNITVEAGQDKTEKLTITKKDVGEYNVSVENLKGVFDIAPETLEIKNLIIDPLEASPGKEIVISATAQNKSADKPLTYDSLKLLINGSVADKKKLELKAGESTTISFKVTKSETGSFIVSVGPKTGTFTVKTSFLSSLPPLVWGIIGVIALVIILLVVMSLTSPKKKKTQSAGKRRGAPMAAQPTPVRPIPVQPNSMQRMPPYPGQMQPMAPPAMPQYPGQQLSQQPASPYTGQAQQTPPYPAQQMQQPPQQAPQQEMPQYPRQQQAPPTQPVPPYPAGQTQQIPQQQRPPYPIQPPKSDQPGMPSAFTPGRQPFGTPTPFSAPPGRHIPQFTVSNLTITPQQVKEGDSVNISAIVINNSTSIGQYSMVLRIGGVVENISELTLNPGTSQTTLFTVTKDTPGEYYVEVDGQRGMFTVIHRLPAAFTVSNLTISPERVKQGEPISINAIVTNIGETTGTYSVVLRVKGIAESIEEVELEAGRSQKVAFNITKDAAGFYPVALENLNGRFVVEMDWKG